MKRSVWLLLGGLVAILLAVIAGCSDDDKLTGNGDIVFDAGDSSFVENVLQEDMFSSPFRSMEVSFELLDSIPGGAMPKMSNPGAALGDTNEVLIIIEAGYLGYSNGWHVFDFLAKVVDTLLHDTVTIDGIDSVQIIEAGLPVQFPNDSTVIEGLKERAHVLWWDSANANDGALHHSLQIDIDTTAIGDTVVTLGGSAYDTLHSGEHRDFGVCEVDLSFNQIITDVKFNLTQDSECPDAGHIVQTVTVDIHCVGDGPHAGDTLDINGVWTVTATVNEGQGTVTVTFTNGIVSWTVTEPCGGAAAVAKRGWHD